jgi:DNA-binding CsgD family transcriptional regulator
MIDRTQLKKMYEDDGLKMEQIADRLGVSRSTVRYQLIQAGIPLTERALIDRDEVKKLYEGGLSPYQIAQETGHSQAGIRLVVKDLGLKTRNMHESHLHRTEEAFGFVPTKERIEKVMKENDYNAASAADALGVKYPTLYGYLRKFGIQSKGVRVAGEASSFAKAKMVLRAEKEALLQSIDIRACEICAESRVFEIAHIYANRHGGPIEKENILILCPTHHTLLDQGKLSKAEFTKVKAKVRVAEKKYKFKIYEEW